MRITWRIVAKRVAIGLPLLIVLGFVNSRMRWPSWAMPVCGAVTGVAASLVFPITPKEGQ